MLPKAESVYAAGIAVMDGLLDGRQLASAVDEVLRQLPKGPVWLVSTSIQGAGLAASCAAASSRSRPIRWSHLVLTRDERVSPPPGFSVVVVEAVDAGRGWRAMVERALPAARIMITTGHRDQQLEDAS